MALTLDAAFNSSADGGNPGNTTQIEFTTSDANDVLVLIANSNNTAAHSTVSAVSDNSGVTAAWQKATASVGGLFNGSYRGLEAWYTTTTAAITSTAEVTVTWTNSGTVSFGSFALIAINGANLSSPIDATGTSSTSVAHPSDPFNVSTSNANDFILGAFSMNNTAEPTAGSGWTQDTSNSPGGNGYLLAEHQIVSSVQTNLSVDIGTGASDSIVGLVISIKEAGGAPVDDTASRNAVVPVVLM
jgi:hypothetical protein